MDRTLQDFDPRGHATGYVYDNWDRPTEVTPPAVEDPADNAAPHQGATTTAASKTAYDLNSNVVREVDQNGNVTLHEYDAFNRRESTRRRMTSPSANDDANDLIQRWGYNAVGLAKSETDPKGNVTEHEYDELLRLEGTTLPTVTLPDGSTTRYTTTYEYGPNSGSGAFTFGGFNPTRVVNARGYATDTKYDAAYRAVQTVRRGDDGDGVAPDAAPRAGEPATQTLYNKVHNPIRVTAPSETRSGADNSQVAFTFYDDRHRPTIALTDMDGDGAGAAAGLFVNDAAGFVADGDDLVLRTAYDDAGNVRFATNALGRTAETVYDGAGRAVRTRLPAVDVYLPDGGGLVAGHVPVTTVAYDAAGNPALATDANGNQTRTFYDARSRATFTVLDRDGDGQFELIQGPNAPDVVTVAGHDLAGNVLYAVDPNGNRTDTEYDRAYRMTTVRGPAVADAEDGGQPARPETATAYDKNGNAVTVTDPRGVAARTEFDELNRARLITAAFGTADAVGTETRHDAHGNAVAVVLHNRVNGQDRPQVTTYAYDAYDRRVAETLPGVADGQARQTATAYDRAGRPLTVTDPKGQKVEADHDRAGRALELRFKGAGGGVEETRTSAYDKAGNLLSRTDKHGTTSHAYDALNRVTAETRQTTTAAFADGYTVRSSYDAAGNRTRVEYPGTGRALVGRFDRANRMVRFGDTPVAGAAERVSTFAYDAAGNRTRQELPNGLATTGTFDALNRVRTLASAAGDGTPVHSAAYGYDLAGHRRTAAEFVAGHGTRDVVWSYDGQYRLTGEGWAGPAARTYGYTYDPAGNRLTRTVDATASGGEATTAVYQYDDLNRLLSSSAGGAGIAYGHDLNGNRTSKAVAGGSTTAYAYDTSNRLVGATADGAAVFVAAYDARTRRLGKAEGDATTVFRYDGGTSFQELQGGGVVTELVRAGGLGGGIGSVLYSDQSMRATPGPVEHFAYNAVGHAVALTDAAGTPTQASLYEAFGDTVVKTGTSGNNRLANTKERDASTGLDDHGFRYYDAEAGRYVTRDPIGYGDGMNVYASVHNDPVNGVDPLGLSEAWPWGGWTDYTGIGTAFHLWHEVAINPVASLAEGGTEVVATAYYGRNSYQNVIDTAVEQQGMLNSGEVRQLEGNVGSIQRGTGKVAENGSGSV